MFLPPRDVARKYQCGAALHCFAVPGKGNAMVDAGRPACGPAGGKTLFPVLHGGARKIMPDVKRAEVPVKRPGHCLQ